MAKITGIMDIKVNGELLRTKEQSSELETGGFNREPRKGGRRVHGYSESVQEAMLDTVLLHASDFDVEKINGFVDATLEVITDTGITYLVAEAFTAEPVKVGENGEAPLKMMGQQAVEI